MISDVATVIAVYRRPGIVTVLMTVVTEVMNQRKSVVSVASNDRTQCNLILLYISMARLCVAVKSFFESAILSKTSSPKL